MKISYLLFVVVYYLIKMLLVVPNSHRYYLAFLNVGQGDSIVINIPTYGQVLIDTGLDYRSNLLTSRFNISTNCHVEAVFITHNNRDHVGGLNRVQRYCRNTKVYDNIKNGDIFLLGDVYFYILNAPKNVSDHEENDGSLVILVKRGDFEALLTGDAGLIVLENLIPVIKDLRDRGTISGDLEVYKVSHHGSSRNSSKEIFNAFRPGFCVISVGRNNYGHPAASVLNDIEQTKCKLYRTDKVGTVMIYF